MVGCSFAEACDRVDAGEWPGSLVADEVKSLRWLLGDA